MPIWTQPFKNLLNLFLQPNCPFCQRPTANEICLDCGRQLQQCHLANPQALWRQPLPVFAWGSYGGMLKRAIAAIKYDNHPEIGRILGQYLGQAWLSHPPEDNSQPIVVPIPLHKTKLKQRGYNQAQLIAESFCLVTGLQLRPNALQRSKQTTAQFNLSPTERQQNLTDAFTLGSDFRRLPKSPILLVDDIYTTGATARAAIAILEKGGIKVHGLAAVATAAKSR
ncbi:MAG: ComF family protein [Calothrix sp. MO_192.B10]|nr:ComF family protein [Calothrix sp. MO_192.B10]